MKSRVRDLSTRLQGAAHLAAILVCLAICSKGMCRAAAAMPQSTPGGMVVVPMTAVSASAQHDVEMQSHDETGFNQEHGAAHDSGASGEGGGHDAETHRADALAVPRPPAWYVPVVVGSAILFLLAIVLGSAAIMMKGPQPADPPLARSHDDHHQHH